PVAVRTRAGAWRRAPRRGRRAARRGPQYPHPQAGGQEGTLRRFSPHKGVSAMRLAPIATAACAALAVAACTTTPVVEQPTPPPVEMHDGVANLASASEIGRASCRERGSNSRVGGSFKRTD